MNWQSSSHWWLLLVLVPYALLQARFLAGLKDLPVLLGSDQAARLAWKRYISRRSGAATAGGLFWLACVAALSGVVSLPRHVTEPVDSALVSFVVDVSNSMLGDDGGGRRIDAAARFTAGVSAAADGAMLSLVAFKGGPVTLCPPTMDRAAFAEALRWAGPHVTTSPGSDIGAAIDEAARPGLALGSSRVIVVLSDGNDTGSRAREAAVEAAASGARLVFVGFGGDRALPVSNVDGAQVTSADGRVVTTALDSAAMRSWAQAARGVYVDADGPDAFSSVASLCRDESARVGSWRVVKARVDASPALAAVALCMLALAMLLSLPPAAYARPRRAARKDSDA
jgi:Ca-activated chloride channel family protein